MYHLSIDDSAKSLFAYTDAMPRICDNLLRVQELRNTPELIALAVNLTQNSRNAEVVLQGDRLDRMIKKGLGNMDDLIFKASHNLRIGCHL